MNLHFHSHNFKDLNERFRSLLKEENGLSKLDSSSFYLLIFAYLACSACIEILHYWLLKGGDPAAASATATLLRLHPTHRAYRKRRFPPRRLGRPISGRTNFRGVTGGVYKARERIHRFMLLNDY